jgi:hypothetical protein
VWPVFAATESVNSLIASDANSMMARDQEVISFFKTYFNLFVVNPPTINQRLATELLDRIEKLYRRVYSLSEDARPREVLEKWTRMAFKNPRRLIRLGIDHLDRHRPLSGPNGIVSDT